MSRNRIPVLLGLCSFVFSLLIWNCGLLPDMSPDPGSLVKPSRRLYINDFARNDSLARPLFHSGIQFVLQANQSYALHVKTAAAGDRLALYVAENGFWRLWKTLDATLSGGEEIFNFQSDRSTYNLFAARFLALDTSALQRMSTGASVASRPWVRIVPLDSTLQSHTLKVHLFMVGRYTRIPDADRNAFATQFLTDLKSVFQGYGIVLDTSSELVQSNSPPETLGIYSKFTSLPGTRRAGRAHMYLVDNISTTAAAYSILGFAYREAVNLDMDSTSRVVLGAVDMDHTANLANTAAHELGHFFGLRHPVSTSADKAADSDSSNIEDGLSSTGSCSDFRLSKPAVIASRNPEGAPAIRPYCLFTAARTASDCPSTCDRTNLMWAWDCSSYVPADSLRVLTSEQQFIGRQNMKLLQAAIPEAQ